MYIFLSFTENRIIIPQCWGGLAVTLTHKPTIVHDLPPGISPDTQVNITDAKNGHPVESQQKNATDAYHYVVNNFDYYFDCGTTSLAVINNALTLFNEVYTHDMESQIADDDYPKSIPAVELLQATIQEAQRLASPQASRIFHATASAEGIITQPSTTKVPEPNIKISSNRNMLFTASAAATVAVIATAVYTLCL